MTKIDVRYGIDAIEEMEEEVAVREYVRRKTKSADKQLTQVEGWVAPKHKKKTVSRGRDKSFDQFAYA